MITKFLPKEPVTLMLLTGGGQRPLPPPRTAEVDAPLEEEVVGR